MIEEDALDSIFARTKGYPFFLQEWGSTSWDVAPGPGIKLSDVERAYPETLAGLDEGFFKVRYDRLTKAEIQFVMAMAALGDGPYPMAGIAKEMGRDQSSLGPARANIISKGMIYSADHGYLDFSVPLFAEYLRRRRE